MNTELLVAARELAQKRGELREYLKRAKNNELEPTEYEEYVNRETELAELTQQYDLKRADYLNEQRIGDLSRDIESLERPSIPLGGAREKTIGELIMSQPELKTFRPAPGSVSPLARVDIDIKTLITTSAGFAPDIMRTGRVAPSAQTRFDLLDFVPTFPTNQNAVNYMEETTFTNNAAEKTQGAVAGEAALVWTERTQPVQTVAVFVPVSEEQLADVPQVEALINERLAYMVRRRVASQGINGNGSSPNLLGVLNKSGIQTQARGTLPIYDAIYYAIDLVEEYDDMTVTALVINNRDVRDVVLTTTTHGEPVFAPYAQAVPMSVFGVPIVKSGQIAENTALVGDFRWAGFYARSGLDLQIGYNADDFTKHQRSIKCVLRCAWVWERPKAFCSITSI